MEAAMRRDAVELSGEGFTTACLRMAAQKRLAQTACGPTGNLWTNQHPNPRGPNLDPVHSLRKLDRLADLCLGIDRLYDILRDEIEHGPRSRCARDFDSREINRHAAVARCDAHVGLHRAFSF